MNTNAQEKRRVLLPALGAATVIAAFLAAGLLLLDPAYRDIGAGLLSVSLAAFVFALLVLLAFRKRTVAAGILKFWLILLMNAALFTAAGIWWFGPVAIFHPNADPAAEAALAEDPAVERILSEGGALSGWRYHCGSGDAPVILYFYGNGETGSRKMCELRDDVRQGYFSGFDLAVFDYPGYGNTPGRPTEDSVRQTALAACDYLLPSGNPVFVCGYSIGTGAANYAAANRDVSALALIAPYADGYDLYNHFLPVFHHPLMRGLVSFKMESRVFAKDVKATPLIVASADDRTVPFASSEALARCYPNALFHRLDGRTHAQLPADGECLRLVSDYFREAAGWTE